MELRASLSLLIFFVLLASFVVSVNGIAGVVVQSCSQDTFLRESAPSTDYSSSVFIEAGYESATNDTQICLKFNLTDLVDSYDLGLLSENWHLRVYCKLTTVSPVTSTSFAVWRITADWTDSAVSYSSPPTLGASAVCEKSFDGSETTYAYRYFNVTTDVQDVLANDGDDFFGYLIKNSYGYVEEQLLYCDSLEATYEAQLWYGDLPSGGGASTSGASSWADEIGDYLVVFIVMFLPALLLMGGLKSAGINPFYGFLAGLVLGLTMGVIAEIIPSWALLVVGLLLVYLLLREGR